MAQPLNPFPRRQKKVHTDTSAVVPTVTETKTDHLQMGKDVPVKKRGRKINNEKHISVDVEKIEGGFFDEKKMETYTRKATNEPMKVETVNVSVKEPKVKVVREPKPKVVKEPKPKVVKEPKPKVVREPKSLRIGQEKVKSHIEQYHQSSQPVPEKPPQFVGPLLMSRGYGLRMTNHKVEKQEEEESFPAMEIPLQEVKDISFTPTVSVINEPPQQSEIIRDYTSQYTISYF